MSEKEEEISYSEAIQKASASITRFPLIPVRGVPLMSCIAQNWDPIWAFRPDPSDLLIATYPKAGIQTAARVTQHISEWGFRFSTGDYFFIEALLEAVVSGVCMENMKVVCNLMRYY